MGWAIMNTKQQWIASTNSNQGEIMYLLDRGVAHTTPEFSPGFITKTFFPEYTKNKRLINTGKCYDWAYIAYCLYDDIDLWTTDNHAWVEHNDAFYDSECNENGVRDTANLGCNRRCGWFDLPPTKVIDINEYKELWNANGAGRRHHWNSLLAEIGQRGFQWIRM